jgi:hypothetical protein
MDNKQRNQKIKQMLSDVTSIDVDKLTTWESDFVISVSDQFDRRGTLSDKQMETIQKILDRHGF